MTAYSYLNNIVLHCQGLSKQNDFGEGLTGTIKAIEHLGYVQVDTLSVVERAHHHTLWNRISSYKKNDLNDLVSKKEIFEYWYHAASYLPMRDYRYTLLQKESIRKGESRYYKADKQLMDDIISRIKADGKISSRQLFNPSQNQTDHLWRLTPNRRAIEHLFMQGDLMICKRNGMEKIFDLTENCLPDDIDLSVPSIHEYALYLFNTTLRSQGVFTWNQLLHLKSGKQLRSIMSEIVDEKLNSNEIIEITHNGGKLYVNAKLYEERFQANNELMILSPFDNLVIHRERLKQLFNFDYRLECYVPKEKRVYGYFCLPILYGDSIVARIDCKVHRSEKKLEILNLHIEKQAPDFDKELFLVKLLKEIHHFSAFNECSDIEDKKDYFSFLN